MRLGNNELTILLNALDAWYNDEFKEEEGEKEKVALLKKMSRELSRRGFTCVVSRRWLNEE